MPGDSLTALVVEQVDTVDLGSTGGNPVGVRLPPSASTTLVGDGATRKEVATVTPAAVGFDTSIAFRPHF